MRAEQYGSFLVEILKLGFQCTNMIPYPNLSSSMCVASIPPSMVFGGNNILSWHYLLAVALIAVLHLPPFVLGGKEVLSPLKCSWFNHVKNTTNEKLSTL